MSAHEDERAVNRRDGMPTALCPKCGSPMISYNTHYKHYECNKCEHRFLHPSGGDGKTIFTLPGDIEKIDQDKPRKLGF
jgi:ribosomal protein S27E